MNDHPLNAQSYDQADYEGEISPYMLCTAPRCGGTLLGSLLYESGALGVPHEYFHPEDVIFNLTTRLGLPKKSEISTYINTIKKIRTSPNGVFGLKAHFIQIAPLLNFPTIKIFLKSTKCFVHVTRKNLLAQAVSYAIAHQSRNWSSLHVSEADPRYDEKLIRASLNEILSQNLQWKKFFAINSITPLDIIYEDLIEDTNPICHQICDAMDIETNHHFSVEQSPFKMQRGDINNEWIERFKSENKNF